MVWKYMLSVLSEPCSFECWTERVLKTIDAEILGQTLESMLQKCNFTFEERENMVSAARAKSIKPETLVDGVKLALSVYNRFINREDMGNAVSFLDYGKGRYIGTGSISINEWIELVDKYRLDTVKEFVLYVMRECIVEQHKRTCFEKMTRSSQSIDGFYFEFYDGKYAKNEHEFQVDFQGIRFIQLMQVMQDLDMFEME